MSNTNTAFVKVYDFTTGATTTIPASELAAGMVRIRLTGRDEILWVDAEQLKQGVHRHPPFIGALREKILYIRQSLEDVYPKTYEEWEDGFRRDLHAEQEIDLWVHLCRHFDAFIENHAPTSEEQKEAFQILVAGLNSTPSTVFEIASVRVLDRTIAQQLIDGFFTNHCDTQSIITGNCSTDAEVEVRSSGIARTPMNKNQEIHQQDPIDVRQLARAIRFALVAIVLSLSYLSLRSSLSIGSFRQIFQDMLGGHPLPALTQFILNTQLIYIAVSVLVPLIAIATLFQRRIVNSFYVIGALFFVTIAQSITLYHGLSAPLIQIINAMSSP